MAIGLNKVSNWINSLGKRGFRQTPKTYSEGEVIKQWEYDDAGIKTVRKIIAEYQPDGSLGFRCVEDYVPTSA